MQVIKAERFSQRIALGILRLLGWRVIARDVPEKCMIMGYPHTSNWDFLYFVLGRASYGVDLSFLAKAEIFRYGAGPILRALGGIPVDRSAAKGVVGQAVAQFGQRSSLCLAIAPEGTRKRTALLKSGFYHMTRGANVPLLLATLDYQTRTVDIGPALVLTGDVTADMDAIRARYAGIKGYRPEQMGVLRLKEEGESTARVLG